MCSLFILNDFLFASKKEGEGMKFFKLITTLLKNWKVLLTLVSVLGFAYCGSVNSGHRSNYTWSASTSGDYTDTAEGGRVSASGGTSSRTRSSRSEKPSEVFIDDYLEQAAYFYYLSVKCDQEAKVSTFKGCISACILNSENDAALNICERACETASKTQTHPIPCAVIGGSGSGFFYDRDQVLTNHHVIENILYDDARNPEDRLFYSIITAFFENYNRAFESVDSIEWHNEAADVAMAELEANIPDADPVELGSLSDVEPNSPVFTIGNPRPPEHPSF